MPASKGGGTKSVTLFSAFVFLLVCAGVYYVSQFHLVQNIGAESRKSQVTRSWAMHSREEERAHRGADPAADAEEGGVRRMRGGMLRKGRANRQRRSRNIAALALAHEAKSAKQQDVPMQLATHDAGVTSDASADGRQLKAQSVTAAEVAASATASASVALSGGCTRERRPYHVIMTAASGLYQEWQSRIAYYHYKKIKTANPCSDIGGFTRLFNTPNAKPDSLMDEIPTLLVKQLGHGMCAECDRGFIVMNRPWGVVQLVESDLYKHHIEEEYVLVIETDHMLMKVRRGTARAACTDSASADSATPSRPYRGQCRHRLCCA